MGCTPPNTDSFLTETRVRPKLLTDLPPEAAKLMEDIMIDNRGRLIPRLYSKAQANRELRNMLNLSAKEARRDVAQLSDAELIAQLADQAKQLGITIDLNYRFAQQPPATASDGYGEASAWLHRGAYQDAWMAVCDADDLTIPPELDRRGEVAA